MDKCQKGYLFIIFLDYLHQKSKKWLSNIKVMYWIANEQVDFNMVIMIG